MQGDLANSIVVRLCPGCGRLEVLRQEPHALHFECEKRNLGAFPGYVIGEHVIDPITGGDLYVAACLQCAPNWPRLLPYRVSVYDDLDQRKTTFLNSEDVARLRNAGMRILSDVAKAGGDLIRTKMRGESWLRRVLVPTTGETP